MGQPLDLELTAQPSEAKRLRAELHQWLLEAGINGAVGHDITLSVVEAFANSVKHPVDRASSRIHVHGEISPGDVTLSVEDDGHWRQREQPREGGGFGLGLMKTLMTTVDIRRDASGTLVTLSRSV